MIYFISPNIASLSISTRRQCKIFLLRYFTFVCTMSPKAGVDPRSPSRFRGAPSQVLKMGGSVPQNQGKTQIISS